MTDGIIDCEHHVLVPTLDALLPYMDESWRLRIEGGEFKLPPFGPHPGVQIEKLSVASGTDPVADAAALDADTVAALLIAPQAMVVSGWLNHQMSAVFTAAVNDYVVEHWLPIDDRFRFAISVSPHDGELAAEEIRRLGDHPGAAAVAMSLIAVNMGHRHYHRIYEEAAARDLPVIIHPGGFEGQVIGPAALGGIGPRTPEETHTLLPQVAMSNTASLIYDGVFQRFPRLKVVFAGFGFAWVPPVIWRADAEWRGLRVEVPWLTVPPSEVAAEHVRFVIDGACEMEAEGAWKIATMLPGQMLLFGSDKPYVESGRTVLAKAPDELRAGIERLNAVATFPRLAAAVGV